MNRNYERQLEAVIAGIRPGEIPHLLLHACCATCSSAVLERLSQHFRITVFYYNPNIAPPAEYEHRVSEIRRFIGELKTTHPVTLIEGAYEPERFYDAVRGLESLPEGGARCRKCFELRLGETAKLASRLHADWFTTTLTISPLKNAEVLNEVAEEQAKIFNAKHLPSDFKKKGGYQRSIELSALHHLYRQDFCGCVYSRREATARKAAREGSTSPAPGMTAAATS